MQKMHIANSDKPVVFYSLYASRIYGQRERKNHRRIGTSAAFGGGGEEGLDDPVHQGAVEVGRR